MLNDEVHVTIIGAGVVGLAIAAAVARRDRQVLLIERNASFGQETSSRNSGVIHAGIYYPTGSLKASLCVRGRHLLYDFCQAYSVPHRRLGKLIVAADQSEIGRLEELQQRGKANGVERLDILDSREVHAMEPLINAAAALHSPDTGIVDAHALMRALLSQARERATMTAFAKEVTGIERLANGYRVTVREAAGPSSFTTRTVVNSAGLHTDRVAEMAGIDVDAAGYRLHYCRGDYFRVARNPGVQRLIYPLPETAGLGIHLTIDTEGALRLGPNATYEDAISYRADPALKQAFFQAAGRYLPWLGVEDIEADFAGVRPKLQGPGDGFRDFVISHETDKGLSGFINLAGIESPGLTASLAIGEKVAEMIANVL